MKKSILVFISLLTTLSLTSFAYINYSNSAEEKIEINNYRSFNLDDYQSYSSCVKAEPKLFYRVGNRWSGMTKEELLKVRSIFDVFKNDKGFTKEAYKNIRVDVIHDDEDVRDIETYELGQSEMFNLAQLRLLHSLDYSSNIRISFIKSAMSFGSGFVENDSLLRYMTIIPEQEAELEGGFDSMIEYLKENIKGKKSNVSRDLLQAGKVFFTVTKQGTISNIQISSTCGYKYLDVLMTELISNMPGKWNPARNSKGEKVEQELVLFFGTEGC